ncbi:regulator of G-protein signaling 14 [Protobothrops mucrosquamatus]|uniref:regulator of G-protein signaling 14 n=1 Tax=Protobothrops mucrosquamatus TaxID=103944 RepID=UPI000775FFA3|nr:regulator of G-protein signaling 14 [Protobothrops mucrosquamatus]
MEMKGSEGGKKLIPTQRIGVGLAVSDGDADSLLVLAEGTGDFEQIPELNSSGSRGSNNSVNSLPCTQSVTPSVGHSVARWAESFETLLQDQLGVAYFTEFLKKEFSAENVYFWQACEQFQQIPANSTQKLAQEARKIYDEFLSSHSINPVNIDKQAWIGEEVLSTPTPDMFHVQQLQIFNLMKFDSYARFVKSALYQACAKADSQGQPLPELRSSSQSGSPPTEHSKKTKLKAGKSLPLGVEVAGNLAGRSPRRSFRKGDRRDRPWGEERNGGEGPTPWRESQGSLNSSASLDLGFLSYATSGLQAENHRKSLTGSESDSQNHPIKYCCIYLPDGTASLAPVRSGLSIQEMLAGVCQRRGLNLPDVKIYLMGSEKKPLALNQDSLVLMDQEVKLETRVNFELHIIPINKTVRILAKSTKTLQEALQPILEKYSLDIKQVSLKRSGELQTLKLEEKVCAVAAQKLVLDSDAGLLELLNRAQNCRVNDQRGLLSKEDLILPDFLQVPEQVGVTCTSHSPSSSATANCTLKAADADTSQRQSKGQSQPQVSSSSPLQIATSSSSAAAGKSDL